MSTSRYDKLEKPSVTFENMYYESQVHLIAEKCTVNTLFCKGHVVLFDILVWAHSSE